MTRPFPASTPIPLQPRPRPPVLPDATEPNVPFAVCSLTNVGKGVPGVEPQAIRYLRIGEGVAWPYCNTYGGQRYEPDVKSVMINWNPVRVLGEVPVEADGSAHFLVPADTPVYFQLLDEHHMELRRMRSFISFQPGERRGCVGCHETREEVAFAPAFGLAMAREPSVPLPPPWGDRAISFLRDVQPVFDKHCVGCHSGLKPAAQLDFSGGLTTRPQPRLRHHPGAQVDLAIERGRRCPGHSATAVRLAQKQAGPGPARGRV